MADCHDNYVLKADGDNALTNIQDSIIYDDGTNVGIGTTSANALLSLGSSVEAKKLLVWDGTGAAANYKYGFGIQDNELRTFYPSSSGFMSIGELSTADASTFSEKMRIDNGGNVGIGTTSPQEKLHVDGDFITKGPWVDVRAFGAKGDDSTDDTSAIQDAIDYLVDNGQAGTVFFPYGTYKVTGRLYIGEGTGSANLKYGDGITLRGVNSRASNLKVYSESTGLDGIIWVRGGTTSSSAEHPSRSVHIIDLGFDLDETESGNDDSHTAIYLQNAVSCKIMRCRIEGYLSAETDVRWKYCIKVNTWCNAVVDTYMRACSMACIYLLGDSTRVVAPNSTVITRCFMEYFSKYGIHVDGDSSGAGVTTYGVVIQGNTIQAKDEENANTQGILLASYTRRTQITGNYFEENYDRDIEIESKFNSVIGNWFTWSSGRSSTRINITSGNELGNILLGNMFNDIATDVDKQTDVINGGKLGVGTTSPDHKFAVSDTDSGLITQAIFGQDKTTGQSQISVGEQDTSDKSFNIGFDHSNSYGFMQVSGDSVGSALVVANGGSVGIGVTSPGEKLEVSGDIKFGTQGVKISTGTTSPNGSVAGTPGDLYVVTNGSSSQLWINTSSSSPWTTWSQL